MPRRKKKDPDRPRPLEVLLANRGNPDYGQHSGRPLPDCPADRWAAVADLAEASALCRRYIGAQSLGGGNWAGGAVRVAATGLVVARISYNGRIWPENIPERK